MNLAKKQEILKILDQEIQKAQTTAEKKKKTAAYFSRHASRSQQGDRRYHEDTNLIAQDYLARLLRFKKEVISTPDQKAEKVESVSFVAIEYQDGATNSFFFTNHATSLPGTQLITPQSPLGKSIEGKKEDESFSYQVEREGQAITFSGKIRKIE